jgi:hypothetical protein
VQADHRQRAWQQRLCDRLEQRPDLFSASATSSTGSASVSLCHAAHRLMVSSQPECLAPEAVVPAQEGDVLVGLIGAPCRRRDSRFRRSGRSWRFRGLASFSLF